MNKKNYFSALMAMFAMISVMILSSCSHDDYYYNEEKAEQALNDQYAIAFEKAFGKVGPNVDWGFGSKNSSTRAFTRSGVAFNTTINFPGDCPASNFLANWPEGTPKLPTWGGNAGLSKAFYIDEAYDERVYTHSGAAKLYVKGDIDLSAGDNNAQAPRFQVSTTSEIYLLEGATLKIGKASAENFIGAAVYIAEGATLETDYPLLLNSGIDVYNHGTINVKDLQVNTNSVLYNKGTVKATGTVSAESNGLKEGDEQSFIVNVGEIECAKVVVNGGAVKNEVTWNVTGTGTTEINSPNSGWINTGHWTTVNYAYVAGSENVINSCYLEVTNDFEMNISSVKGSFKINSGGGVLASNFYGGRDSSTGAVSGPFKIEMAENAVFVVKNDAQFESGRGEIDNDKYAYGIFGPTEGGYAVFQAKNIVRDAYLERIKSWGAVTYRGHLYVSAENHFAQGNDGMASHLFIFEQDGFSINDNIYAAGFKSGKPNITIEETNCCPGFQGDDPNPTYRVIAEDLNAQGDTDFDFNDVVFDVEPNEAGTAAKITVLAAGGIYRLEVDGVEVHKALLGGDGQINENGFYPMINTGDGPQVNPAVIRPAYAGDFSTDANIRATIQNITVKVWKPLNSNSKDVVECTLSANRGEPASKVLVDNSFKIVPEHHSIANNNGKFTDYVQGSFQDDFWWK